MEETVEQIKSLMAAIEKHYQEQIATIDEKTAVNKQGNGYTGIEAELLEQRKIQDDVRDAAIFRLKGRLKEAEAREEAGRQAEKAKRDDQAASLKAKALEEWTKAGGTPAEFEQAYPAIRSQILQAEAIRNMTRKPLASNKTL
jgi:hypothetical protein